ncbi:MAG: glucose 1-dehydrogenase [Streptosporangiales bacterium]|nr:glucose 1-dehydrogenase [Streptosporangiales bacterium]
MRLADRVAIVTGGADGLGKEIAKELGREGAVVVVADIDESRALDTVREIEEEQGGRAMVTEVDVADPAKDQELADSTFNRFGRLDILVNNAGVRAVAPFLEQTDEIWRRTLDVDLGGPFLCMRACIPYMIETGKGKILNIASVAGIMGFKNRASYCAAKAGVIGLTKAVAFELSESNIYVNAIAPGVVETPMTSSYFSDEAFVALIKKETPMGRWGQPADIAKAVTFLVSDDSDFVSGAVLPVDGGWVSGKGY